LPVKLKNWELKHMSQDKPDIRVLVAPLDWGIGHAARCIPVIRSFIDSGCEVIIGTSGNSGIFLRNHFPELRCIDLPYLKIRFGTYRIFPWHIFQLLKLPFISVREHFFLRRAARKLRLDLVVSDNRYGLYNKDIYTVIITHQLFIRLPGSFRFFQKILWKITGKVISRFDECWIPDFAAPGRSLSNELSHGRISLANYRYIGLLSRFALTEEAKPLYDDKKVDLLVILSGPEPQRTVFENVILNQIKDSNLKIFIFRGLPAMNNHLEEKGNLTLVSNPDDEYFKLRVRQADKIICRSGYSTIMDLIALERRALLVPAPGQTEQIYLARYLASKGSFLYMQQKDFNLKDALNMLEKNEASDDNDFKPDNFLLEETVSHLMNTIDKSQRP
jgi:uncharacterized protein (TIGR00661 family)